MPGRLKGFTRWAAVLAVGVLVALVAGPAQATVVDRGTFAGSGTEADELCGIAVVHDFTFSGKFRVRVDKASDGQAFFQRQNFDAVDVFTNPDNGRSMTFETHDLYNEVRASLVGGNVYRFTAVDAGQPFTVRDGAGNVVLRDRGVIRHVFDFDTLGDGMPGGIQLEDVSFRLGGPHPGFDQSEEEFCAMVESLIG
jgi:hypothetical protein